MSEKKSRPLRHFLFAALGGFFSGILIMFLLQKAQHPQTQSKALKDQRSQVSELPRSKVEDDESEDDDDSEDIEPEDIADLRSRKLIFPLKGFTLEGTRDSFHDARDGAVHGAIDIVVPRNTPVLAVEDGTIARLWLSKPGGITVYHFDPEVKYAYYYAHLEKYAENLKEGDRISQGEVIGYVGTSGNAAQTAPHLHFAIFKLTKDKHWWEGTPINPYLVFSEEKN